MNGLLKLSSPTVQGANGSISGRGLPHRKLTLEERVSFAADVVTGQRRFDPSLQQACGLFSVPTVKLRNELQRRARLSEPKPEDTRSVADAIVELWDAASDEDRAQAVDRIGPGNVWDALAAVIR
jgi:hypothetical protein